LSLPKKVKKLLKKVKKDQFNHVKTTKIKAINFHITSGAYKTGISSAMVP
jgi:hypothetical protein